MRQKTVNTEIQSQPGTRRVPRAKRVCMHVLNPARTDGRVMREARALVQAGYDVTIVDIEHDSTRPQVEMLDGVRLKHVMISERLKKYYKPTNPLGWIFFKIWRIVLSTARVFRTKADVYHAHDAPALPACYLAARLRRKKLVLDAHEMPLGEAHIKRRRMVYGISHRLLRRLIPRCAAIITVSGPLVEEIHHEFGGPRAVQVRNALDYTPPVVSNRLREELELPLETRIAIYQGGFQANRHLDLLVRAAKYIQPHHRIVLMGSGETRDALKQLAIEEAVTDRVTILPAVPYEQLLSWTASADLGLIIYDPAYSPNVRMCLPNKLFEYLMAGVPVLSSSLEAVVEVEQQYQVGTHVASLDPADIGQTISATLANTTLLAEMRRNALAAAHDDLNWATEQHALTGLYERLVGPAGA